MTSLKDLMQENVHQRDLKIKTFKTENNQIIVEGSLIDNRLIDIHHHSGVVKPAGTVHFMVIRLLVDSEFTIREVETEMPCHPHDECPETINSLQQIKDLKITRGFTMKIKEMFGKGKGCSHLSELIIAMGPATVQGAFTAFSSTPLPESRRETMKPFLQDTCWVWRKDGNAIKKL